MISVRGMDFVLKLERSSFISNDSVTTISVGPLSTQATTGQSAFDSVSRRHRDGFRFTCGLREPYSPGSGRLRLVPILKRVDRIRIRKTDELTDRLRLWGLSVATNFTRLLLTTAGNRKRWPERPLATHTPATVC